MFVLFVDLKKAYDSVPRKSLWSVMKKCGIPPTMLSVVRSLHDGMSAEVTMNGQVAPEFEVSDSANSLQFVLRNGDGAVENQMQGVWS